MQSADASIVAKDTRHTCDENGMVLLRVTGLQEAIILLSEIVKRGALLQAAIKDRIAIFQCSSRFFKVGYATPVIICGLSFVSALAPWRRLRKGPVRRWALESCIIGKEMASTPPSQVL